MWNLDPLYVLISTGFPPIKLRNAGIVTVHRYLYFGLIGFISMWNCLRMFLFLSTLNLEL